MAIHRSLCFRRKGTEMASHHINSRHSLWGNPSSLGVLSFIRFLYFETTSFFALLFGRKFLYIRQTPRVKQPTYIISLWKINLLFIFYSAFIFIEIFSHKMYTDNVFSSLIYPNPPHLPKLPTSYFLFLSVLKPNRQKRSKQTRRKIKPINKEKTWM